MKAIILKKYGDAALAFEQRELATPVIKNGEVLIKVKYSGLNFADVMARRGMYKEAPPLPCILGYDVTGTILETGAGVHHVKTGDRVMAFTRFGGYADHVVTDARAVVIIPVNIDEKAAIALTTQYCTAWYAAAQMVNLHKGDKVLVQAGAGGVGIALIQYAKHKGCEIFATAGNPQKIAFLEQLGVHHPISYRTQDFQREIETITNGSGLDVVFDAVGGSSVKKGIKLLAAGGRLVCYGASVMTDKNVFGRIKAGLSFGFYHPAMLMMPSKSIIGINMLKVGDSNPGMMQRCLESVIQLTNEGVFVPRPAQIFPVKEIATAHTMLENRQTIGKVALEW
ncbi:MAG: zinc-binding dehydrogenase [Bacteroidota bacterium]